MTTNTQDNEGRAPLHLAAMNGDTETVRLLISAGADVHAKDSKGSTALHLAVLGGHSETAQVLIEAEAAFTESAAASSSVDGSTKGDEGSLSGDEPTTLRTTSRTVGHATGIEHTVNASHTGRSLSDRMYASDRKCEKCRVWNRWQSRSCSGCGAALEPAALGVATDELVESPQGHDAVAINANARVQAADLAKKEENQEELDIEAINRAARAQVADEENREKAKNWQMWVHAIVMLPVLIGVMINYGWIDWVLTFTAWLAIVPWYCVSWVCGKIAYGIVRSNK